MPSLYPFVACSGRPCWEKSLRVLSLLTWVLVGGMYTYTFYVGIYWTLIFPLPNSLATSIWLTHVATRFLSMWMPMGLLLIHWRATKAWVMTLYILGAVLTMALSIVSVLIILGYSDLSNGELRKTFFLRVKDTLKEGDFPSSIKMSVKFESCCSWYGPMDFFEVYKDSVKLLTKDDFTSGVEACYGGSIAFKKGVAEPGTAKNIEKIDGCYMVYEQAAAVLMNFVVSSCIVTGVLTPIFIALFIYGAVKTAPSKVSPEPQSSAVEMEADEETEIPSPKPSAATIDPEQ